MSRRSGSRGATSAPAGALPVVLLVALLVALPAGPAPAAQVVPAAHPRPAALGGAGAAPTPGLWADRTPVPVGRAVTLRGRLADPGGGARPGTPVGLEAFDPASGSWQLVEDLVTDAEGTVTASLVPARTTTYRLHRGQPGAADESTSREVRVRLTELTATLRRAAVRSGRTTDVQGVLVAAPGSVLELQRRTAGRWTRAARTRTAADQSYSFAVTPTSPGFWRWRVVRAGAGGSSRLVARLPRLDAYRLHTYSVTTRGAVQADVEAFRTAVAATYADPRGWARAHHRFREVPSGGALTVVLARAAHVPGFASFCSPSYSCQAGRYVVINAARWARGSPHFPGTLAAYRGYLVDHETGHWLGLGHAYCARRGALAPVMQQQSKGMQGCRPNSWPLPREVRAVS